MNNPTYRFIGAILAAVLLALCVMEGQVAWARINNDITTGSGGSSVGYPFALTGNATSTLTQFNGGITAFASSTIGNATQAAGLTISGGATTTGNQYVAGSLGVGTNAPVSSKVNINTSSQTALRIDDTQNDRYLDAFSGGTERFNILYTTAGNLELQSYGGAKMVINDQGNNVSIGTINNGSPLTISGGTSIGSAYSTLTAPTNGLIVQGSDGIGTSSPFAKLSIHANNGDTNIVLFAIGSSTQSATTTLFQIDNQGNFTESGPSTGSATKGTCFKAKNANANSFTFWYFPTAGAAPTYQTADCGGAGTTTITYQ
jgi:hypothetical protein